MIEFAIETADALLGAWGVGCLGAAAWTLHSRAAAKLAGRADALSRSLARAKKQLAQATAKADAAESGARLADRLRVKLALAEAARDAAIERAGSLDEEASRYAKLVAETLDDCGMRDMPEDEAGLAAWAQSLREFGDDRLTREIMERVTLAQVFDAIEYGRGPLASYARALRLGAFAPEPPRPRLNLPASDIEAICADLRALPGVVSAWDRDLALKAARGATHGAQSRAPAEPPREGARSKPGSRR